MTIKIFVERLDATDKLEKTINDFLKEKNLTVLDDYEQEFHFLETHIVVILDY